VKSLIKFAATPAVVGKWTAVVAVVALSACSALESDKVDYRATTKAPDLTVPPDLTQLKNETRYAMVDGGVSANSKANAVPAAEKSLLGANAVGDVRIERSGTQRWLVVKRKADVLWDPVKDFWQENGFLLAMDQSNLGIMETEWAENRAKIPQDFIRSSIGKLLDNLYSTPERDKYRTRLETNANGETEIFISHRGVTEVYVAERTDQTVWQPRPADPELEAEFLRRLMIKLGSSPEQAAAQIANATAPKSLANAATVNGHPVVQIGEGFDRAWRHVGLALDRTGFTVEDRDRNRGIYFVRYVGDDSVDNKPGFFSRMFGGTTKAPGAGKYQILVSSDAYASTVTVQTEKGEVDASATAQRIVKVIADDIK
jgi:outer membrane protein assembly factor BamC